jgi:LVIVD repeat
MRTLLRLVLPIALIAMLALPALGHAQANLKQSANLTHLVNVPNPTVPGTIGSDFAFWGNLAFPANYATFRIYDISNPAAPALISETPCFGGQADISVWRNLAFRSVDRPQTTEQCAGSANTSAVPTQVTGFEGIRILDISNPAAPQFVKAVPTDCGSHTHTLIPDLANNRLLLYISSYPSSFLGPTPYGTQCSRPHDKISIIEVPLSNPAAARVIATPTLGLAQSNIFGGTGAAAGCHDISAFLALKEAAGACLSEGVIFDISDPANPTIKHRLVNPAIDMCARATPSPPANPLCLWHSATYTWDGKYIVFGDEAGGGGSAECSSEDPPTRGAFWLHRRTNPTFPISSFKIPRVQPDPAEVCTAHIMNFVPINGRYALASSWYYGGTSMINWTNINNPFEFGYFEIDPPTMPGEPEQTVFWTTYWYNDYLYTNDEARGWDVLRLEVPWRAWAWNLPRFNPQTQESLIRCRVVSHGGQLRAGRRGEVHVIVSVLGGQPVVRTRVALRGAGVRMTARTNTVGEHMFMVRPRRAGTLRVVVREVPNMLGCSTTRRVRAARVGVAGTGAALTGRS